MNKLIKELAEQANVLEFDYYDNESEIEKFAELIVRECARMVDQEWHLSGAELKEHFGVEE